MTIRPATPRDLSGLADLHARAFARAWDEAAMKSLLDGRGVFALVADEDDLSGFILARVAADETEILSVAVSPDMRQRGLASRLLEQACHRAATEGAARIFLEVAAANLPARNLYGKYGFREVGRRTAYYEDGEDALVLSAALPLAMGNSGKTL
ncbi:MAG TPA: ribosomal protein S18-alanine N-acetyltransferase [Rhizomicrobium sp.]|nr:ribosomal protein S18-alanine N-acetyltransferase [Rhizomicrobium sp.]